MNESRFDMFARLLAGGSSRRRLLGKVLPGLAVATAMPRLALHGVAAGPRGKGKKKRKVTLCQNGQTISVARKAKKRFLRQGATVGACAAALPPPPQPSPPAPICAPEECPDPGVCKVRACAGDICAPENAPNDTNCGSDGSRCVGGECCPALHTNCFGFCMTDFCRGDLRGDCNDECLVQGRQCCGGLFCQRTDAGDLRCRPPA